MRRSAILVLACVAALAALTSSASAASNGMLAAVAPDGRLVTVNRNGSGLSTLWTPGAPITGLAWSPDGNELAVISAGKLVVWDLPTAESKALPTGGNSDPTFSADGLNIGFRRGRTGVIVSAKLDQERPQLSDVSADSFAWAPNLTDWVRVAGTNLYFGTDSFELLSGVIEAPAWSSDVKWLAVVSSIPQMPAEKPGLYVRNPVGSGAATKLVAELPARAPTWSPDGELVLYDAGGEWRTVPRDGGQATAVPGLAGATLAAWQPCDVGSSFACESAPPSCSAFSLTATTQAGQPTDLPPWPCTDPAHRGLKMVVVKAPEHGLLEGQRYVPAPGYVGPDSLSYTVSNGAWQSEVVQVKIFVVPRPAAASVLPAPGPTTSRAPFLTARATPKLDRRRTALVKLACDQNCSFEVRLTGQLKKGKKTVRGSLVKRTLSSSTVLSLRLRLPKKPKGTLKTVWITGTVRNAAGESRPVKLPVRLPR